MSATGSAGWTAQLSSYTFIIFGPGRATATAYVQNASGSATTQVTQPLQLRRTT